LIEMTKRLLAATFAALLSLGLVACGGGSSGSPTAASAPTVPSVSGHYDVVFVDTLTRLYDGATIVLQCGGFVELSGTQSFSGSFAITHGDGCTPASGTILNGRQQLGGAVSFNTEMGNQADVTLELLSAMGCALTSSSQGYSGTIIGGRLTATASGTIQCVSDGTIRMDSRIEGSR
jgi:hypothetical protein